MAQGVAGSSPGGGGNLGNGFIRTLPEVRAAVPGGEDGPKSGAKARRSSQTLLARKSENRRRKAHGSKTMTAKTRIVVFVCDDEPIDLSTIRRILEDDSRFVVLTCSDYTTGVNLFAAHGSAVTLALLDVALPGRSGIDLARHMLSINPEVKIIFVSGHVGKSVLEFHGIRASDEHFLRKPFDDATLLRRVDEALQSQRPLQFVQSASGNTATNR
jgi:CheY-like chemotaxis protein